MNPLDKMTLNMNWRFFIIFLLIFLILGLLLIYLIFPSIFNEPEIRRIPINFDDDSESRVDRKDVLMPTPY